MYITICITLKLYIFPVVFISFKKYYLGKMFLFLLFPQNWKTRFYSKLSLVLKEKESAMESHHFLPMTLNYITTPLGSCQLKAWNLHKFQSQKPAINLCWNMWENLLNRCLTFITYHVWMKYISSGDIGNVNLDSCVKKKKSKNLFQPM